MQVQTTPLQSYYSGVLQSQGTAQKKQANNFAALLAANGSPQIDTSTIGTEPSLTELYEQMTTRAAPTGADTPQNGEAQWTDSKLAGLLEIKHGILIDTTKTINWNSTGKHTLTAQEAAKLKKKYDVENLSPQDYYDLLSELTHLNVLTASDIKGMHIKKIYLGDGNLMVTPSSAQNKSNHLSFSSGNIMDTIQNQLDYLSENISWSMTDEFLEMNPAFAANGALKRHMSFLDEQTTYYSKLQSVFGSIMR